MAEQPPDGYEQQYMGGGSIIARDRKGIPLWMHALLALPMLAVLSAAIATGKWALLAILPFNFLLWILFAFLRVTVTQTDLHVQYGLFGPKIPLQKITHIQVGTYDWHQFGGWGLRYGRNGVTAYSVPGGQGLGFEVHYQKDDGSEARAFVTCERAHEIVQAIQKLNTRLVGTAASTAVRADVQASQHNNEPVESARESSVASSTQAQRSKP